MHYYNIEYITTTVQKIVAGKIMIYFLKSPICSPF